MPDKTQKKYAEYLQKAKLFSIFLGVAVLFWLFNSFSSKDRERMVFQMRIAPDAKLFLASDEWRGEAVAFVKSTGFKSVFKNQFPEELIIQESWINNNVGFKTPYILPNKHLKAWQKELSEIQLLRFENDTLWLPMSRKAVKKVPVSLPLNIDFKSGYRWLEPPQYTPDSVAIVGAQVYLDAIKNITADTVAYTNLRENIDQIIKLKGPFKNVFLKTHEVRLTAKVARYTEHSLQLPITVQSDDLPYVYEVFPKTITLNYQMQLDNHRELSERDFEVVCQITKAHTTKSQQVLLTPYLAKKPDDVVYYNLDPPIVNFFAEKYHIVQQ